MRVTGFKIEELYDIFDYEFHIEASRDIFILTGPNGYGKTTILNILYKLSEKDLGFFYSLPFKSISIKFDDVDEVCILSKELENDDVEASDSDVEISKKRILSFEWNHDGKNVTKVILDKYVFNRAEEYIYGVNEVLEKERNAGQFLLFLSGISVIMLPSNRLAHIVVNRSLMNEKSYLPTINEVSDKIKSLLEKYYLSYLKSVNSSNSSIFEKLLKEQTPLSQQEYERISEELSLKLVQLHEWGLSSEKSVRPFVKGKENIMSVYIQELEHNLDVYKDLYVKLLLFKELVEKKEFVNKTISVSPKTGLTARTASGMKIGLDKLSSGEQHEIIMLFYSIFEVSRNSILLIDEPENSLHVAWQLKYCDELKVIAEKMGIQVLVATHSPQIIGERWDECYDLYNALEHGKLDTDCSYEG